MKKFFRIFLFVLLGAIIIGTFVFLYKKSKPKVVLYETVCPEIKTIEKKTIATGKVEPRDEILIKPQINGIIETLYKEAGQQVKADEIIAKVKVVPEMNSLNNAESLVAINQISFDKAKIDYDRVKKLYDKGISSKEEYEQAEVQYQRSKQELQASKDALDIVKTGMSARSAKYSTTMVRSTVTGLVLNVPVKVGSSVVMSNNFNDGTTIASVANMSDMLFVGKIDETEVGTIKQGAAMSIYIGALKNVKLNAVLEQISPKGIEENGAIMFEMKASVTVPDSIFVRAGYSANAEIVTAQSIDVLTIPESCVEFAEDTAFVQIVTAEKPKQTFERRNVTLGLSDGISVEIKDGITQEDKLRGSIISDKKKY
jgi:HlyD family secretion protein